MGWGSYLIAVLIKKKVGQRLCEIVCHSGEPHSSSEGLWPLEGPFAPGPGPAQLDEGGRGPMA